MSKTFKYILDFQGNTKQIQGSISGVMSSLKGVAAAAGLAFGAKQAVDFVGELAKMSGEAEGVHTAFNKIANSNDLDALRNSVHGTVSDLNLMKRAVSAQNFGIPVKELGNLFAFATKRAQDTGQSVDYLVDSIVTGIGRKSPLILDNLGISASQLKEKLHGVGLESVSAAELTKAVGEIAQDSFKKTGDILDTNAIKIESITAKWENFKLSVAEDPGFKDWVSNELKEADDFMTAMFSKNLTGWQKFKAFIDVTGQSATYFAEEARKAAEIAKWLNIPEQESSGGPLDPKSPIVVKQYANSIEGLGERLKDYNEELKQIAPNDRGALMTKLAQINAIEEQIKKIDKLKAAMATMADDKKSGFRSDKLTPIAARGTSAQNVGWDLYKSVDQVDPTKLFGTDQINENLENNKKKVADWREQLVNDAQVVASAFEQGFNQIGESVIAGLGLAQTGFEGFIGGLAETAIKLISIMLSESLANSIAGATASGTATGPAAIFTTPAFIATAIAGVMGAFAAIPKFASGGLAYGPTMGMIGEYPGASSNPEVIAPLSKLKALIGGGNQQAIILRPSLELGYSGLRVRLQQEQNNVRKRT
jgi:hypothetical protein